MKSRNGNVIFPILAAVAFLAAVLGGYYFWSVSNVKIPVPPNGYQVTQPIPKEDQQKLQPPEPLVPTPPAPLGITNSGIKGKMTIWPNAPRCQTGKLCSGPYQGTVLVKSADGTQTITQFTANSDGTFKVNVPAGQYILTGPNTGLPPILMPQKVTVENGKYTEVSIQFDSGMR